MKAETSSRASNNKSSGSVALLSTFLLDGVQSVQIRQPIYDQAFNPHNQYITPNAQLSVTETAEMYKHAPLPQELERNLIQKLNKAHLADDTINTSIDDRDVYRGHAGAISQKSSDDSSAKSVVKRSLLNARLGLTEADDMRAGARSLDTLKADVASIVKCAPGIFGEWNEIAIEDHAKFVRKRFAELPMLLNKLDTDFSVTKSFIRPSMVDQVLVYVNAQDAFAPLLRTRGVGGKGPFEAAESRVMIDIFNALRPKPVEVYGGIKAGVFDRAEIDSRIGENQPFIPIFDEEPFEIFLKAVNNEIVSKEKGAKSIHFILPEFSVAKTEGEALKLAEDVADTIRFANQESERALFYNIVVPEANLKFRDAMKAILRRDDTALNNVNVIMDLRGEERHRMTLDVLLNEMYYAQLINGGLPNACVNPRAVRSVDEEWGVVPTDFPRNPENGLPIIDMNNVAVMQMLMSTGGRNGPPARNFNNRP